MGAWISYGLGSLNDNLPTFVVLPDHRGFGPSGPKNWGSAFLPALRESVANAAEGGGIYGYPGTGLLASIEDAAHG